MLDEKQSAKLSLDEIAERVASRLQAKEGGKMSDSSGYVTVKDFEHQKTLEKLTADAERKKAEYQQALETMSNQLKEALDPNHRKHCTGSDCAINRVHSQIFEEGVAYAKQHLTVDNISPKLVGDWIREMHRREGK